MTNNPDFSVNAPLSESSTQFAGSIQRTILLRTMTLTLVPLVIVGLFAVALSANALPTQQTILWGSGFIFVTIIVVAGLNLALARSLAQPIVEITRSATAMAEGDFKRRLFIDRDDEIGLLAQDFNVMSDRLQALVNRLELQVEERTQALEVANQQLQGRAFQLETNVRVNRVIAPILELEPLCLAVVEAMQERFDFFYVALLVLETEEGRFSVFEGRLAAGEEGRTAVAVDPLSLAGQAVVSGRTVRWPTAEADGPPVNNLLPPAVAGLAVPVFAGESLVGVLELRDRLAGRFDPETVSLLEAVASQVGLALQRAQLHAQAVVDRDRTSLLYEVNKALGAALDFETIMRRTLGFTQRLGAAWGGFVLQTPGGTWRLTSEDLRVTGEDFEDLRVTGDDLRLEGEDQESEIKNGHSDFVHSIAVSQSQVGGVLRFGAPGGGAFSVAEVALLRAVASQVEAALENTTLLLDIQTSLRETHLLWEISRQLAASPKLAEIYAAVGDCLLSLGADRCALFRVESRSQMGFGNEGAEGDEGGPSFILQPIYESQGDLELMNEDLRFQDEQSSFENHQSSLVHHLRQTQETVVIERVRECEQLSPQEMAWWGRFGAETLVLCPLVARGQVVGVMAVEFRRVRSVGERTLTLFRTLANQATVAMENARQVTRTEVALAETQTLYRAGRVLARAADLTEILEEALIEFLYSLGLDQGGIVLLNQDRTAGQVVAYVQEGVPLSLLPGEGRFFDVVEGVAYQEILLAGQPFVSGDAARDGRLVNFKSFNQAGGPKSILLAPMIVQGETVGWIGADAVHHRRQFAQREVDLARAMADQIAIAMQNRRLLEQTQRRAEQLQAVAQIGESVSEMIDLQQILEIAVELIRSRFKLYHVSIFVVDDRREWAVVRASAGVAEAAQTMVSRPHQLAVGGSSIVGFVTGSGQPRIALDVGQDAVWFNNPLLPLTRSEMALPLVAHGGVVMGALDVQSQLADAFGEADVEILQIMANQLTAAMEKAHLFEQAQRQHRQTQQNQQFLRAILNQLPDPIFIKDQAGRLVVVNQAFAEWLVGRPESQLLGQPDSPCWPTNLAHTFRQQDERVFATGKPVEWEFEMVNAQRQKRTLIVRKTPLDLGVTSEDLRDKEDKEEVELLGQSQNDNRQSTIDYLIGVVTDITERTLQELERERLMQQTRQTLKRTQALYEISHTLDSVSLADRPTAGGTDEHPQPEVGEEAETMRLIFQTALSHYLALLGLTRGSVWLLSQDETEWLAQAWIDLAQPANPDVTSGRTDVSPSESESGEGRYPLTPLFAHLQEHQAPVVIKEVAEDPLAAGPRPFLGHAAARSLLALPLVSRRQLRGLLVVVIDGDLRSTNDDLRDEAEVQLLQEEELLNQELRGQSGQRKSTFSASDIELGRTIAGQVARWLENRQLLAEAEYRAARLATVAQISQAASSILELADLLESSVNLIREQFDFYYVGLFMVEGAWAVLKAGTGEAGRRQLARQHRLRVGEGMIGWSVQHGQPRIALDVGEDAVRFANPDLPLTRSELALPLISREEVLGALTVQSTQARAFSAEDITLLQTMADQLANAIKNADLLSQTQAALLERERLYQISQDLLSAEDEGRLFRLASHAIAQSGADWCRIFTATSEGDEGVKEVASWYVSGVESEVGRLGGHLLYELLRGRRSMWLWDGQHGGFEGVGEEAVLGKDWAGLQDEFKGCGVVAVALLPLEASNQRRLGFLAVGYETKEELGWSSEEADQQAKEDDELLVGSPQPVFSQEQLRFYSALGQQLVVALENLRLLQASQRRARREEIIREITSKIHRSNELPDIMRMTVGELGKITGSNWGWVRLPGDEG